MDTSFLALFSSLLIFFSLLPSASSATSLFLACGSSSPVSLPSDDSSRTFNPDDSYLNSKHSVSVANRSSSSYATARVFSEDGTYRFSLNPPGTYFLRLHFFPFSTVKYRLSDARFDVSALGQFLLLSDFSVPNSSSAIIKEFFLPVDSGELEVTFSPTTASPFAFVNAIEVFDAPTNLIPDTVGGIDQMSHQALELMYRINVGGPKVTPRNDTLWRTWLPDDGYLLQSDFSKPVHDSPSSIRYQENGLTKEIAPEGVYDTARTLNYSSDQRISIPNFNFNLTWRFQVNSGYQYWVRMHFCDFVSLSEANSFIFDAFVDEVAKPGLKSPGTAQPFYWDFVTKVASSGLINVSISRSLQTSATDANAILNGLEIWKANNSVGSLSGPSSVAPSSSNKKSGVPVAGVVSGVVGGLVLVGVVALLVILLFRKRKRSKQSMSFKPTEVAAVSWSPYQRTSNSGVALSSRSAGPSASPRLNLALHIPFVEIKVATNDFDEKLIIGSGGFGKVYRGELSDGTKVAVKRGSVGSRQGYPEFQTEIIILSQIRHKHLVSLIGYCEEMSERILVYEYLEKGTLRAHLYGSPDKPGLSWKQRLEICIGAARGLHYLHTGYTQTIIHRDVKSTNILLGEDYLAKVSDFGLSKLTLAYGETHVTTVVKGTFGYFDPEYFKTQKLTEKSDVYSFGVMLLEVLCARPVIEQGMSRDQLNLAEWGLQWQRKGQLERIVDARLIGKINKNSLRKFGETAEKCLAEYGIDRPTFADILWNLEYALQLQVTEVRREAYEDSGGVGSQIPTVDADALPSGGDDGSGDAALMSTREFGMTESSVFSQLIGGEGR